MYRPDEILAVIVGLMFLWGIVLVIQTATAKIENTQTVESCRRTSRRAHTEIRKKRVTMTAQVRQSLEWILECAVIVPDISGGAARASLKSLRLS